jgi:ribosome biogenesis GTPase
LVIDTPGMREFQLSNAADGQDGVDAVFADVEAFAAGCRFADCAHRHEPGCAVRTAIEQGALDAARFGAYEKLLKERRYEESRDDPSIALARKRQGRIASKAIRRMKK